MGKAVKRNETVRLMSIEAEVENGEPVSKFWLRCVGWHAAQGGKEPTVASLGFNSLEELLKYYVNVIAKDEKELLECCKFVYSNLGGSCD